VGGGQKNNRELHGNAHEFWGPDLERLEEGATVASEAGKSDEIVSAELNREDALRGGQRMQTDEESPVEVSMKVKKRNYGGSNREVQLRKTPVPTVYLVGRGEGPERKEGLGK